MLANLKEGEAEEGSEHDPDNTISVLNSKITSAEDGLFSQIDRLTQSVGELEYEVSEKFVCRSCSSSTVYCGENRVS